MKLPNRKNAIISRKKLTEYLLSETHTTGRLKAKFFSSIGFDEANSYELEKLLLTIAQNEKVNQVISSPYGKKYIIEGSVETHSGKAVKLRTVWIIESKNESPRFVTAYPV